MPEQRTGEEPTTVPLQPAGLLRPVPFERLLSVATLTPAQASLVAVQLLDAVHAGQAPDGEPPGATCLGAVTLMPSGDVDVEDARADGGTGVTELLERLLHNARRLPAHPRDEQLLLLRSLEEVTRDPLCDPGARARELEGAMVAALGPDARQRITAQLAALVDAFAHMTPSVPGSTAVLAPGRAGPASANADTAPAAPRRAPGVPVSTARPPGRPARRQRNLLHPHARGRRLALVALLVVGALAISSYLVLRGPGSGILGAFGNSPSSPATSAPPHPSTKPAPHARHPRRQAVATLAPRRSGSITGVTVQKTARCAPGGLCPVKVTVHFRRASTARTIGWKLGAARLCVRGITWSAPTKVTARAGWSSVYASSSVRVPKGRSLALVALTTTPARAQSRPVPVSGSSLHC